MVHHQTETWSTRPALKRAPYAMAIDRHRLTNLPLTRKLAATLALLLGLALFVATWLLELEVTDWSVSTAGIFTWGERLTLLRTGQPQLFWGFFAAHALSLLLLAGVATGLLRQVAIARGARTAVVGGIFVLTAIDLAGNILVLSIAGFSAMSLFHELLYQRSFWLLLGAALATQVLVPKQVEHEA